MADICNLTCQYVSKICSSNYLWKFLEELDFPQAILLLDNTVLSASSVVYRFLYSAALSLEKQNKPLEHQFNECECKVLVESMELTQCVDSLQSKLFTLQTDGDPNTPVSKLQEQVTHNLWRINLNHLKTCSPRMVKNVDKYLLAHLPLFAWQ